MFKFVILVVLSLLMYVRIMSSSMDPMFDSYINTITHLPLTELMRIPEKSDEQFLYDLFHNDDSIEGITHRQFAQTENDIKLLDQIVGQAEIDEDWEGLMVAGPISVNYIGNLMVLSSKKDFPFNAPPSYEFRHIRFPTSFQATLAQVSSEMYKALLGGHTAMDRIQTDTKQIPGHVKTILKLLTSASPLMIKKMLPLSINHIARLANESVNQANKTVEQFTNLLNLLDEISQLSITTGTANKILLEDNEKQMNGSIDKQNKLNEQLAQIQTQYKAAQEELEAARKEYQAAFNAIPNSGGIVHTQSHVINKLPLSFISQSSNSIPIVSPMQQSSRSFTATVAVISSVVTLVDSMVSVFGKIFGLGEKQKEPAQIDNTAHTNAMEKANLALQRLREAEDAHRKQFESHLLAQNNLANIMHEMAQLDLTKLRTDEIAAILVKATKQIIDIREQWAKLVQFFTKVSVQATTTQDIIVSNFIQAIETAQFDNEPLSEADRAFFLEIIIPTVSLIDREAGLLYGMASTYYKVSGGYMLGQIAGVTKLLLTQTDEERQYHLQSAFNLTTTNSQKVIALATQMRTQFLRDENQLINMYENYVAQLLAIELGVTVG